MTNRYINRQLFADHWLDERLRERADYQLTPLALMRFALWTRGLDAFREAGASTWGSEATADRAAGPCLAALGFTIDAWQTAHEGLWPSEADLVWQRMRPGTEGDGADDALLVAVCPWADPLDAATKYGGGDTNRQAGSDRMAASGASVRFLRLLSSSDVGWGVLTNGQVWRLYRRGGEALEAYYEVNLIELAARRDIDALKYFYLFFSPRAHLPAEDARESFLEVALAESRAYAAGVEDDLRARAFDAISAACQGLAEALAAERGIPPLLLARDDLRVVYTDALALLYRLLFVFYAESRELLPVHDERYAADFSLREVIARLPASPETAGQVRLSIWPRLSRLFRALNGDTPSSVVPAYSGRLFDVSAHPLLARLPIADAHLARMLILLGRTRRGDRVDYADLAVRQLGSIYEGLLEHQEIRVAEEEMALVKGPKDKAPQIVRRVEAGQRRILETYAPGTVYLSNDKGERHAAGTYYTPEPVVRYLVEETLGPLVAGRSAEQIIGLKVLDPAMGSGHFLVAAVDYLARAALAAQAQAQAGTGAAGPPESAHGARPGRRQEDAPSLDGDVMELKRRIAEQCIYGVDINESAVELAKLSLWLATAARDRPLTFLDLHLRAGNSLIGLGPGELDAAAQSFPLGARGRGRRAGAGKTRQGAASAASAGGDQTDVQMELWSATALAQDMFRLVGGAQVIDMLPTETVDDVRTKAHLLTTLEPRREPYRRVADLYVSLRFGNRIGAEVYAAAVKQLLGQGGMLLADATLAPVLAEARRVHERQRVFHWELEFPEVFRDANGQPLGNRAGFDAVVGNPPYVSVTTLRAADPDAWQYYPQVFISATRGQYDLYAAFVERALALLHVRGRMAYILPNKWLTADFGAPLRELLSQRHAITAIVDFRAYQVFPTVSNYTCLLFAGNEQSERIRVIERVESKGELALPPAVGAGSPWLGGWTDATSLGAAPWNLTVGDAEAILTRWNGWPALGSSAGVFQGTGSRADPVFIVFERARAGGIVTCYSPALDREVRIEAELLHPVLQGRDIQPYAFDDHGARLLSPYRLRGDRAELIPAGELAEHAPHAWAYLNDEAVRRALEGRENGHFKQRDDWYGFGRPQNMHLLPRAKLVLPDVAARGRVAYDGEGHDIVDTAYGIAARAGSRYAPHFLAAALNSPVLTFFLRHRGTDLRGGYFRMKTAYLNPFPLPPIAWRLPDAERRAQAAWAAGRALAVMRTGQEAARIAAAAYAAFPGWRGRAECISEMLHLDDHDTEAALECLRYPPALEPVGWEALRGWAGAQGLGPAKSDLTRAEAIAGALAEAADMPLHLDAEWLKPAQLQAVLLLIAARLRGQGVMTRLDAPTSLSAAVEQLRHGGVDIRIEGRGRAEVATLIPAVELRIGETRRLEQLAAAAQGTPLDVGARLLWAALQEQLDMGLDGIARGRIAVEDLALRCGHELHDQIGELASSAAAEEIHSVAATITVGPPLPLASDLPHLGRAYRFFDEALRVRRRAARPGIALLLSSWLTGQDGPPRQVLAINPHLALLYLIAADAGAQAESLARRDAGWYLDGQPLVPALDARLRALGYEVWDEGYREREADLNDLGMRLVEQGLRSGVLERGSGAGSPLEAPASFGFYGALDLLDVAPATRSIR